LTFALDGYSLRLQQAATPLQPGAAAVDALHPSEPGVVPHRESASIKLLVGKVRVTSARWIGIVGLVLAALLALAGFRLSGRNRGDELTTIRCTMTVTSVIAGSGTFSATAQYQLVL